jgi:hypothetical protein
VERRIREAKFPTIKSLDCTAPGSLDTSLR